MPKHNESQLNKSFNCHRHHYCQTSMKHAALWADISFFFRKLNGFMIQIPKRPKLSLFSLLFRQTLSFSSYWKQRQLIPFSWVNQCSPEVNGTVFWNLFCLNEYRNQKNQKKIWKNENKRPHLFNNQLLFFLHNPVHYTVTAEKKEDPHKKIYTSKYKLLFFAFLKTYNLLFMNSVNQSFDWHASLLKIIQKKFRLLFVKTLLSLHFNYCISLDSPHFWAPVN